MDTTDPDIKFDVRGICSHCQHYDDFYKNLYPYNLSPEKRLLELQRKIEQIKQEGLKKKYDCIIGLSGGVDSTYTALKAKQFGLKPLAVHLDNGWDSEQAVKNIELTVRKLGIDLYTHVIDWEEFKELQKSFFKASIIDIEILTDHAIFAAIYEQAKKYHIRSFISGVNFASESTMPKAWVSGSKLDAGLIKSIQKKYGKKRKFNSYLLIGFFTFLRDFPALKRFELLNFLDYNYDKAKKELVSELGWNDYGLKHYESVFTRFYQGYILPNKFGIDKRRAHYSSLIYSGQLTREEALAKLEKEIYEPELLRQDREFVIKKLDFTVDEFNIYMKLPMQSHLLFKSYTKLLLNNHIVKSTIKTIAFIKKPFNKLFKLS